MILQVGKRYLCNKVSLGWELLKIFPDTNLGVFLSDNRTVGIYSLDLNWEEVKEPLKKYVPVLITKKGYGGASEAFIHNQIYDEKKLHAPWEEAYIVVEWLELTYQPK